MASTKSKQQKPGTNSGTNSLKFARDRRRYLHWVFEATKRFGLSVLDHMVTSLSRYEQKMQNRPEFDKDVERFAQLV
ncbi:MAG TPA: hypothetical protein VJ646_06740 [Candidatus Binatia bacterium]|nr:hypothetical protein [Candidatus Binatia bacterium]